jgi:hypothetical protein
MNNRHFSAGFHLVDRLLHASLLAIVLIGAGNFIACSTKDAPDSPGDSVAVRTQGLVVQTDSDVGTLPGDISISVSGTTNYAVPLWTPTGRAGMTPPMVFTYSSAGAGDGHLGVGWSLSGGISMIHRCAKRSPRQARPAPVSFVNSEAEQYCLDGQPLVLIGGTNGAQGAEYRTEPDSFTKVVIEETANGARARFTAYTRDGRVQSYGSTVVAGTPADESLLVVKGNRDQWELDVNPGRDDSKVVNHPTSGAIYGWLRGSVRDRSAFPNYIWFKYSHPADRADPGKAQEPLLISIEYVDVSGFPTRQIQLTYAPLPDADAERHEFIAGMPFKTTQRLVSIDMLVADPGTQTLKSIKQYKLNHDVSGRSPGSC